MGDDCLEAVAGAEVQLPVDLRWRGGFVAAEHDVEVSLRHLAVMCVGDPVNGRIGPQTDAKDVLNKTADGLSGGGRNRGQRDDACDCAAHEAVGIGHAAERY
jgi:hypothetical protein